MTDKPTDLLDGGAQLSEIDIMASAPCTKHLPMATYHEGPGVSKSQLDLVHLSPALLPWSRNTPEDTEADSAVDIGSALHTLLLEPDQFDAEYVRDFSAPRSAISTVDQLKSALLSRRIPFKTSDGKGALTAALLADDPFAPVTDALREQWQRGVAGRQVLDAAEWHKLMLMRDSVMAHETARLLLETEGETERCHYWIDELTGELCRCRIDREIPKLGALLDLKTTATMDRFDRALHQYRYHVQDVWYSEGYAATQKQPPRLFAFIVVGTIRDRKRYPTRVFQITEADRDIGRAAIRQDMATYAACRKSGDWNDVETITLPHWAGT